MNDKFKILKEMNWKSKHKYFDTEAKYSVLVIEHHDHEYHWFTGYIVLPEVIREAIDSEIATHKWHVPITFMDRLGGPHLRDTRYDHRFAIGFGTECCSDEDLWVKMRAEDFGTLHEWLGDLVDELDDLYAATMEG